jgi:hypothetical protein
LIRQAAGILSYTDFLGASQSARIDTIIFAQLGDFFPGVTELHQYFLGVLAELGRG